MIVTYFGNSFLKFQLGSYTVAVNPISKQANKAVPTFGADVVVCSASDPFYHGNDTVTFGSKIPFLIDGPGEYEVGNLFIRGIGSTTKAYGYVTSYVFKMDDISVCIIGPISSVSELTPEFYEAIDDVGILCVPIAGKDVLDAQAAHKLAVSLGARLIIPLEYAESQSDGDALASFLKESGVKELKTEDKLTIKKSDLAGKECVPCVLTVLKKGE